MKQSQASNSFSLQELINIAEINFQLDAEREKNDETSCASTTSALTLYKMQKEGWQVIRLCSSRSNLNYGVMYRGGQLILSFSGMKPRCPIHYALASDALLVANDLIRGRVHQGFYQVFEEIWPALQRIINNLAANNGVEVRDLQVTCVGHSMGGAVATLVSYALSKCCDNCRAITFGSPRLLSPIAAALYDRTVVQLRVTHGYDDPVVGVAPGLAGYQHVGVELALGRGAAGGSAVAARTANGGAAAAGQVSAIGDSSVSFFRHSMLSYLEGVYRLHCQPQEVRSSRLGVVLGWLVNPVRILQEMTIGGVKLMVADGRNKIAKRRQRCHRRQQGKAARMPGMLEMQQPGGGGNGASRAAELVN